MVLTITIASSALTRIYIFGQASFDRKETFIVKLSIAWFSIVKLLISSYRQTLDLVIVKHNYYFYRQTLDLVLNILQSKLLDKFQSILGLTNRFIRSIAWF